MATSRVSPNLCGTQRLGGHVATVGNIFVYSMPRSQSRVDGTTTCRLFLLVTGRSRGSRPLSFSHWPGPSQIPVARIFSTKVQTFSTKCMTLWSPVKSLSMCEKMQVYVGKVTVSPTQALVPSFSLTETRQIRTPHHSIISPKDEHCSSHNEGTMPETYGQGTRRVLLPFAFFEAHR